MDVSLIMITCPRPGCGITFWITETHDQRLRDSGDHFYCPDGHSMDYRAISNKQRIIELEQELAMSREWGEAMAKSNAAYRGVITKMKRAKKK